MIARSTDHAADRRFSTKVAVPDAGATESCPLGRVDETRVANADCHFPSPRGQARDVDLAAAADDGAPGAPTGADERSVGAATAAPAPGATWANVARDGANENDPPGSIPRFRRARRPCPPPSRTGERMQKWTRAKAPGIPRVRIRKPSGADMDESRARLRQQGSSRTARRMSSSLGAA